MKLPPSHERRVFLLALAAGFPAIVLALLLLFLEPHSAKVRFTFASVVLVVWLGAALAVRERVARSLHVVSALLAALREGDFSLRGRLAPASDRDDALAGVLRELNVLADTLRSQRLGAVEAGALLRTVMAEIDVAVLAVDESGRVRLANPAAERLLGRGEIMGRSVASLGLAECLQGEAPRTLGGFAGGAWELRRSGFRQDGLPHTLLVLTNLRRALREEERQAWQRLVRVLGHEINNSLAPIQSIAGSLRRELGREPRSDELEADLASGLDVIARRSEGLARFLAAYARLARLPAPRLADVDVRTWVTRVVGLERRVVVKVEGGPDVLLRADGDQLDQLLINLVQNAVDAVLDQGGHVEVSWRVDGGVFELSVSDDGLGVADSGNLFVPFFTTKPGGSGIGLALSRQIAEAHAGALVLENRKGVRGAVARVRLWDAWSPSRSARQGGSADSMGLPVEQRVHRERP